MVVLHILRFIGESGTLMDLMILVLKERNTFREITFLLWEVPETQNGTGHLSTLSLELLWRLNKVSQQEKKTEFSRKQDPQGKMKARRTFLGKEI